MFLFFFFWQGVFAQEMNSVEFKATSLMRSGHTEKALLYLESHGSQFKKFKYHGLKGRVFYLEKKWKKAKKEFELSLQFKPVQSNVSLILAQTWLQLKKPQMAMEVLSKTKIKSLKRDLVYSKALWDSGKKQKAVQFLENSSYQDAEFMQRQVVHYYYDLAQISKVFEFSLRTILKNPEQFKLGLYVVSLLKKKDLYLSELYFDRLLEVSDEESLILKERGLFEIQKKRPYMAALFLSRAAQKNKDYAFEAAQALLNVGKHYEALYHNSQIKEGQKRFKQLFSIYVDLEDYEKAASLRYELEKYKLIQDQNLAYALLYTFYKTKDFKNFNRLAARVTSDLFFYKVAALRDHMRVCLESWGMQCLSS